MIRPLALIAALMLAAAPASAHFITNPAHRPLTCLPQRLMGVVDRIAHHFGGRAQIVSAYRSPAHNRAVHGARHSYHMRCQAVDFEIAGIAPTRLAAYARAVTPGGVGLYDGSPFIHVDTGPRRQWHWHRRGRKHRRG